MSVPAAAWDRWDVHPSVAIGLAVFGGLYVVWGGTRAPLRRQASFWASVVVLFLALDGPLHDLADHYLFSAHMVQHLVLTLVFPPLLLYGTPAWVVRPILAPRWVTAVSRRATRGFAAGLIFSAVMVLWHLPVFYEAALEHHPLHIVQHLMFLAAAVIVWWPVLSPVPELPRLSYPAQILYFFLLVIPMNVVGAFVTLADHVLYPFYAAAPRVWGLAPLADQKYGGLIMWVPGSLAFLAATTVVWFRWALREERGDVERAVPADAYGAAPGAVTPRPPTRPAGGP